MYLDIFTSNCNCDAKWVSRSTIIIMSFVDLSQLLFQQTSIGKSTCQSSASSTGRPSESQTRTKLRSIRPLIFARCHQKSHLDVKVAENLLFTTRWREAPLDAGFLLDGRTGVTRVRVLIKVFLLRNIIVTTRVIVRGIAFSLVNSSSQFILRTIKRTRRNWMKIRLELECKFCPSRN